MLNGPPRCERNLALPAVWLACIVLAGCSNRTFPALRDKSRIGVFLRTDCPISNRYAPTVRTLAARYAGRAKFQLVDRDKAKFAAEIEHYFRDDSYKGSETVGDPQNSLVKLARVEVMPEAAVFDSNSRLFDHGRFDNRYQSFGHP